MMLVDYFIACGAIMLLLAGWIAIQRIVRWHALRHPEFGPPREEGGGCGKNCLCKGGGSCNRS